MKQIGLDFRAIPEPVEKVPLKRRYDLRLEELEEDFLLAAGNAHALELKSADPYREGQYSGVREMATKAAQMIREVRREFNGSRVKDMMSRR